MMRLYQILFLIVLLTIPKLTDHLLIRNILGFTLIFLIVEKIYNKKNYVRLAIITLLVILFLELVGPMLCSGRTYETFENVEELINAIEKMDHEEGKNKKEDNSSNNKPIEDIDVDVISSNKEEVKTTDGKSYTPATAQKAAYELTNTIKDLHETLEKYTPSLQQAQAAMNAYKQLNLEI